MADRASDEPSASAAAYPRWILLEYSEGCGDPDAKTVAHARTSKGRPIIVSFVLAAPPAVSRLRLHSPGLPDRVHMRSLVIAAHGDSVLVNIETTSYRGERKDVFASDYFIYCAGDAATKPSLPPSLSLLPPCYLTKQEERKPKATRYMPYEGTAILRRGHDDVLVAALDSVLNKKEKQSGPVEIELCLLRSGDWEVMRLPVIHDEGKTKEVSCWWTDGVIPVGDRFLLWVDYYRGIIYSDVWQQIPELRYVSLPVEPNPFRMNNRGGSRYRSLCATAGGSLVRFVEVFSRCCCGYPLQFATTCAVSHNAFTVTTWALQMDDMMTWDKVGVIDCDEIWSLPGYHGVVPRIKPEYLTVSLDDPDVICFVVNKNKYKKGVDGDLGTWLIELDTRRMELRSICNYDLEFYNWPHFTASSICEYFDASSRRHTLTRPKDTNLEARASPSKLTLPKVVSHEKMLGTLREIPNLARDDMLKAYAVLASDESQFKFRSLLALPMDMRKYYCLVIEKLPCSVAQAGVVNGE
ncbi:unnamed protein product [Alopecurus aequalis]